MQIIHAPVFLDAGRVTPHISQDVMSNIFLKPGFVCEGLDWLSTRHRKIGKGWGDKQRPWLFWMSHSMATASNTWSLYRVESSLHMGVKWSQRECWLVMNLLILDNQSFSVVHHEKEGLFKNKKGCMHIVALQTRGILEEEQDISILLGLVQWLIVWVLDIVDDQDLRVCLDRLMAQIFWLSLWLAMQGPLHQHPRKWWWRQRALDGAIWCALWLSHRCFTLYTIWGWFVFDLVQFSLRRSINIYGNQYISPSLITQ